MSLKEKLKEVDIQLRKTTSPYRKRDLEKYKKRLIKELKRSK